MVTPRKCFAASTVLGMFCWIIVAFAISEPARSAQPVRIVTYNAEILVAPGSNASRLSRFRFDIARREHLERVASVIETLQPDILNLVEVTSATAVEMLVEILHEKGLTEYQGYHVESKDTFTGLDVALITRLKPDTIEGEPIRIVFSPAGDPTWRSKFTFVDDAGTEREYETSLMRNSVYYFTIGQHKLGFLGLHLKSNPEDAYSNGRRTGEAAVAQKIIRQEIVARGYTPVVLGDINDYDPDVEDRDESRSTATQVLAGLKDYAPDQEGVEMFNAAERIVRQADRYTSLWDRNENGAADPEDVTTMIDHILLHRRLMPMVKRVHISHVPTLETSDHFPVIVDLELP